MRDRQNDKMTREIAERMTLTIRNYWLVRGKNVAVWVDRSGKDFVVRSDMFNGKPRDLSAVLSSRNFA